VQAAFCPAWRRLQGLSTFIVEAMDSVNNFGDKQMTLTNVNSTVGHHLFSHIAKRAGDE